MQGKSRTERSDRYPLLSTLRERLGEWGKSTGLTVDITMSFFTASSLHELHLLIVLTLCCTIHILLLLCHVSCVNLGGSVLSCFATYLVFNPDFPGFIAWIKVRFYGYLVSSPISLVRLQSKSSWLELAAISFLTSSLRFRQSPFPHINPHHYPIELSDEALKGHHATLYHVIHTMTQIYIAHH